MQSHSNARPMKQGLAEAAAHTMNTAHTPEEAFYGEYLAQLRDVSWRFEIALETFLITRAKRSEREVVSSWKTRIKSPESMITKLESRGFEPTAENAAFAVNDAVGVRIICPLVDDVAEIAEFIRGLPDFEVVEEKDYIRHPKPNGYRSHHLILAKIPDEGAKGAAPGAGEPDAIDRRLKLEVQLRTIAMDSWASIEHELKYKKHVANQEFLAAELKRCADEMAATDLSLQTIADLIAHADENDER